MPITVEGYDSYADPKLEEFINGAWSTVDQSVGIKDFWQTNLDESTGKYSFTYVVPANGAAHHYRVTLAAPVIPVIPTAAATPIPNGRAFIEGFTFDEQSTEALRDYGDGKTVKISVQDGANMQSLVPHIVVSRGATVSPASDVAQDFTQPVVYTVTAQNGVKIKWTVTVKLDEPMIIGMQIPEQAGANVQSGTPVVDLTQHTVTARVKKGTDLATLQPAFTLSSSATITPGSGTVQDFSAGPVAYTVNGPKGIPHVWNVRITEASADENQNPMVVKMNDAIADKGNWTLLGAQQDAGNGYLTYTGGAATYNHEMYQNELLDFNYRTEIGSGSWPLLAVRTKDANSPIYSGSNEGYLVVVKQNTIELQRFKGSDQHYFYQDTPNTVFTSNVVHHVQFGAINEGANAVRLIFTVDGQKVFDYLDTDANRIMAPGYFQMAQVDKPASISVVPTPVRLNDAIADKGNWTLLGAQQDAGNGYLTYTGGAATYNHEMYQNELLDFNYKTEIGSGSWPIMAVRTKDANSPIYSGSNEGYLVVVKQNTIELQRFKGSDQHYFYQDTPNTVFTSNVVHHVQFGAINVGADAVRLILTVDGQKVFDYLDTDAKRIMAPGYFQMAQVDKPASISVVSPPTRLNDAIADKGNWTLLGAQQDAGNGYLTYTGGAATYNHEMYQNELLDFNYKTEIGSGSWPIMAVRTKDANSPIYSGSNEGYLVVVKQNTIELQRFKGSDQHYFYQDTPNTVFTSNAVHHVQFGAINVGEDAVRLIFTVDGQKVFDYLDTDTNRIMAPGYFQMAQVDKPASISIVIPAYTFKRCHCG